MFGLGGLSKSRVDGNGKHLIPQKDLNPHLNEVDEIALRKPNQMVYKAPSNQRF